MRGAQCASKVLDRGAKAVARGAAALSKQEKSNSADFQWSKVNITGFNCTVERLPSRRIYLRRGQVVGRGFAAVLADASLNRCYAACARGTKPQRGARCASQVLDHGTQAAARGAATPS
jgi:hypothetical protein